MAVTIKNAWHRVLLVNIKGKKEMLRLMPRGTAQVSEKDLESPELKNLISCGDIRIKGSTKAKEPVVQPKESAEKPKAAKGKES